MAIDRTEVDGAAVRLVAGGALHAAAAEAVTVRLVEEAAAWVWHEPQSSSCGLATRWASGDPDDGWSGRSGN